MANEQNEPNDRRQQILEAALKVFSTKGYHKATNKDIAEAAGGISPGLIYWYFKDKQDVFLSLLRERAAAWMRIRRESDSKAPCRRIDNKDTVVLVVSSKTSIAHVAKRGLVGSIDATALVDAEGNWKIAGTVIIEAYVSLAPDVTDPQAFSVKACIVDPMVAKSKPKLDQWEGEQLAGLDSDDGDDNTMHSSQ